MGLRVQVQSDLRPRGSEHLFSMPNRAVPSLSEGEAPARLKREWVTGEDIHSPALVPGVTNLVASVARVEKSSDDLMLPRSPGLRLMLMKRTRRSQTARMKEARPVVREQGRNGAVRAASILRPRLIRNRTSRR